MGRQNYDSIYFSRYKLINRAAKMLMVAFLGPQHLVSHLKDLFDKKVFESALSEFAKHFARWPLDLACSIPRKDESAYFHSEYIIPQLLFQWMLKDGRYRYLCYRSAQIPDDPSFCDYRMALNFVFPPKTCKPNGYADELSNMFTLTDPVSFELAVALGDDTNLKSDPAEKCNTLFIEGQEVCDLRDIHIASVKGKRHVYCATDFGKAEIRSASFPFAHLESCD